MDTMGLISRYAEEMIAIRRHIHAHPELSGNEFQTTALIREKLSEYGIEVADLGLRTGTIGILRGQKNGKTVAIREDIDALPMEELTGLPYASKMKGVCHSCGHDIHTAVLLCCARALVELRDRLCGNAMFLFQPAEETGTGAKELAASGFTDILKPDVFIGLHVSPEYPAGCIGLKRGPANASADIFHIRIDGKGGHGAHPENCIDPVAISAYVLTQLQTVISRENHPIYPAVMTVGSIRGGKAPNVIPDYVEMDGTLRSLNQKSREAMQAAIERIVVSCAEAMRGHGKVVWEKGMPPLINDDAVIRQLRNAAEKTIGPDHVITIQDPSMGSEDFSFLFPSLAPGAQFRLGTGKNEAPNTKYGLHNSKNVFDDSCLTAGAAVMVQFVRDFLQ